MHQSNDPNIPFDTNRRRLLAGAGFASLALPLASEAAGPTASGGYPGFVVAASNAPAAWIAAADFQATGSNDQIAIQAAVNAASAAGGGLVVLSPGLFTVAASASGLASDGAVQLPSRIILAGSGREITTVQLAAGSGLSLNGLFVTQYNVDTQYTTLSDLTLDGNLGSVAGVQSGFFCGASASSGAQTSDIRCYRVLARNFTGHGFAAGDGAQRVILEDCIADSNGDTGSDGFNLSGQTHLLVSRCVATNNSGQGFNLVGSGTRIKLSGCTSQSNFGSGYEIHGNNTRVLLTACTGRINGRDGLNAYSGSGDLSVGPADQGFTAIGCEFSENGGSGVLASAIHRGAIQDSLLSGNLGNGLYLQNANGYAGGPYTVSTNTVFGNGGSGLVIAGVPYCSVTDNDFRNNCTSVLDDQIRLSPRLGVNVNNSLVANNLVATTQGSLPRYGINEEAGGDRNLVYGNRISGTRTAGVKLNGAGSLANAGANYSS